MGAPSGTSRREAVTSSSSIAEEAGPGRTCPEACEVRDPVRPLTRGLQLCHAPAEGPRVRLLRRLAPAGGSRVRLLRRLAPPAAALALLPGSARAADYAGAPLRTASLTVPAAVQGERIALAADGRLRPRFWPGVHLGSTIPGTRPGEVAATRRDYDRWLRGMGALGVRVVRVYTVLRPAFYDALAAYNRSHPARPLRFIQGVWIPEERFLATGDAYDGEVTRGFEAELADAVAVVHGRADLPQRPGHAGGRYRADVSRWLLAWSPGVEWDPEAVRATDARHAGLAPYAGRYVSATSGATPMESWLAARLDHLAGLEARRGWSRPLTFTNWATTDPLHHPEEPLEGEDLVSVDAAHLRATDAWPGGFFASYHVYPYYPEFVGLAAAPDPYAAYLRSLRAHHAGQPVMITEFGVPSGLGAAHRGALGRDQGDHSETEAGAMNAAMLREIRASGMAGGIVFEWVDEWFKHTWNTQALEPDADRRALWRNVLTNEEQFGLIAAEAGRRAVVRLDGRAGEWRRNGSRLVVRGRGPVREVRAASDAAYLHLLVRRTGRAPLQLGFDVRPGGNRGLPGRPGVDPRADVALTLGRRSSRLAWAQWADPFSLQYGLALRYFPLSPAAARPGSGRWVEPRLLLDRPSVVPATGARRPMRAMGVGVLRRGRSAEAGGNDDRALVAGGRGTIELRIPWGLLLHADPSAHRVLVPRPDGTTTTRRGSGIGISVAPRGRPARAGRRYEWAGWNRVRWHERRKAGWPLVRRAFAATAR